MYNSFRMSVATNSAVALYPLPSFYFKVIFTAFLGFTDTSFQEVTGIGAEMETEDVAEGGENRFVHHLPTLMKHPQLELKRGIAPVGSALVAWCQYILESGFSFTIVPSLVTVYLLDASGLPARGWAFSNAYPVKWKVDDFNSTKNDVAIETITLNYTYSNRIL
jgi:phage tail-like protein